MMGAFHCPHCGTVNACDCDTCTPYIKEGEYVNKWTEDGEGLICGKCSKIYSPDQSLDEEFKQRNTYGNIYQKNNS
jgi:transcription elongation factor Elf1